MRASSAAAACAACLLFTAAAGAAAPGAAGPAATATRGGSRPAPAGRLDVLRYRAPVPPAWVAQAPASTFRAAQYRVPAAPGATDGEVVVFYFGPGQGGSVAANTGRWASQFAGPHGQPARPAIRTLTVGGMPATIVELTGTYACGVGMGQGAPGKPGQTLLAAVVEAPEGNLTFQLHGDRATVARHRGAFEAMLKGLRAR